MNKTEQHSHDPKMHDAVLEVIEILKHRADMIGSTDPKGTPFLNAMAEILSAEAGLRVREGMDIDPGTGLVDAQKLLAGVMREAWRGPQ